MLFNSLQFGEFFVCVYFLYLVLNHKWQNRMLLAASCFFYGAWDWRFLFLMFSSISVDYFCAIQIDKSNNQDVRKRFLWLSLFINLSILGFFKYFNFFSGNLCALFAAMGLAVPPRLLNIILPVGISFYTFEAMSYIIDVYKGKCKPAKNYLDYALFVAYFPHLVAGPIMRAKDLLPQMSFPRKLSLDKFYEGCYLIFFGLFQKMFVADNLAKIVDPVFAAGPPYEGVKVLLALYAFAFQIYCDFAGYSNIARGLGKCMGFDIMINFNLPYFATNPREFWQRWHISLSTWLRDYLYIPLGGNQKGVFITYRNIALTMLLGGLWHGAAWTYVIWGLYHGLLLMAYRLSQSVYLKIIPPHRIFKSKTWFVIRIIFFFHLICVGWLFFRSQSLSQAFHMIGGLLFNFRYYYGVGIMGLGFQILFFTGILLIVELFQYRAADQMILLKLHPVIRSAFYFICFFLIFIFGASGGKEFIYFQF